MKAKKTRRLKHSKIRNGKFKVVKHKDFLSLLTKCKDNKQRSQLIDYANKDELKALSEIMLNVLSGNIKLTPKILKKLKRDRAKIRTLVAKGTSDTRKKKILKQKGGILPIILPLVSSVLGSLFK